MVIEVKPTQSAWLSQNAREAGRPCNDFGRRNTWEWRAGNGHIDDWI